MLVKINAIIVKLLKNVLKLKKRLFYFSYTKKKLVKLQLLATKLKIIIKKKL